MSDLSCFYVSWRMYVFYVMFQQMIFGAICLMQYSFAILL